MAFILSPNMSLPIASVGNEPGPNYAYDANSSFTLLDGHDHSPGKGVQITPAGLNINADLTLQSNNLTQVGSIIFSPQTSDSTLLALYVKPGTESPSPIQDLWFNDGVGNQIQITAGGAVNATIASIPGESYAFGTFTWRQGTGSTTPANFDIGAITIRPTTPATTFGTTLSAASVSTSYTLSFMPALPGAQSFLTVDASGNLITSIPTANGITASNIANMTITATQIANATITTTQIAAATILGSNIAAATIEGSNIDAATITGSNVAAATIAPSNLTAPSTWSGSFTGPTTYSTAGGHTVITISSYNSLSGRPVFYSFSASTATGGNVNLAANAACTISVQAGLSTIFEQYVQDVSGAGLVIPISAFNFVHANGVGTNTQTLLIVTPQSGSVTLDHINMNVIQI